MKHCPLHHVTYVPAKFKVATANFQGDKLPSKTLFDLNLKAKRVKVTQNIALYPRLHVTYAPANFDVATSYG